jgi:hypothetical protein
MDFILEGGQVTGFKFREYEAKRVEAPVPPPQLLPDVELKGHTD